MWRSYLDATRLLLLTLDRQLERDSDISFTDFELLVLLSEATEHRMRMSALAEAVSPARFPGWLPPAGYAGSNARTTGAEHSPNSPPMASENLPPQAPDMSTPFARTCSTYSRLSLSKPWPRSAKRCAHT